MERSLRVARERPASRVVHARGAGRPTFPDETFMPIHLKFQPARSSVAMAGLIGLLLSPLAQADFSIAGFELVHSVPLATDLATPDLRQPGEVWIELFDGAQSRIDIGQFYTADHPGSVM